MFINRRWGLLECVKGEDTCKDLFDDDTQAKCEAFYLEDTLPRHLGFFDKLLAANPESPWLCGGSAPTIADFNFATIIQTTFIAKSWPVPVTIPERVQANVDALYALPAVKEFKAAEAANKAS